MEGEESQGFEITKQEHICMHENVIVNPINQSNVLILITKISYWLYSHQVYQVDLYGHESI